MIRGVNCGRTVKDHDRNGRHRLADFIDYIALLLRALLIMQGLQMLLLGVSAFLMGIALARVARRLRLYPALPLPAKGGVRRQPASRNRTHTVTPGR